ncbi:YopX family protein [Staphylococcus hominis]|uniref:YopX protein domain-containing protein n=1 Tax=Staphylococcus hominis TaxID=1290 RepID=A0A974QNJ5_STAHO|nr:YopX family protein [Staphylococcus hominis]PTK30804.1 hypothetical protein BUZ51_06190 [Staphylococcus hominis]RIO57486.1 hypothetical protein BUZ49_08775 [Staphylococcus hominis]
MIPKLRAWDKRLRLMIEVGKIDFNNKILFYSYWLDGSAISFDEVELMKSTGLKDKNGTEIYEGDIVQHSEKPNPCFSYPFKVIQARTGEWRLDNFRCGTVLAFSNQDELEVLGNIYENPELLEGE